MVAGWVELGGSKDKKPKIFKQNWIILISFRIIEFLVIWHDPTHWPTQIINLQTEVNYLD